MERRSGHLVSALMALTMLPVLIVLLRVPATAGVYDDPKGRFSVDLPRGWRFASQPNDLVTVFEDGDEDLVMVVFYPAVARLNREALLAEALGHCKSDGMVDLAPVEPVLDLTVNGNPARYGIYRGFFLGDTVLTMDALLGAVELEKGGVSYRAYLNKFNRKKLLPKLEEMFLSIRNSGRAVTGVAGRGAAGGAPASPVPEMELFEHRYGSVALPPGWQPKELGRNFEEEVVGWFMSERTPGASVLAVCYRGFGMTMAKAEVAARRTVEASLPDAVPADSPGFVITDAGGEATTMTYTGSSVSAGRRIQMKAMTATLPTKGCKLALIGFVASGSWKEAQLDMIRIVRSAR